MTYTIKEMEEKSSSIIWDKHRFRKIKQPRAFLCSVPVHDTNILITGKSQELFSMNSSNHLLTDIQYWLIARDAIASKNYPIRF